MPTNKKPRRSLANGRKARNAAAAEKYKTKEREHYTREFARLNSKHTAEAIDAMVKPMEKALYAIENTGDGLVDREGDYVFCPHDDDEFYPLADGLFALCKALHLVSHDERRLGLMRVGHKLQAHMPLFPSDMDAAWIGFGWAREELADLTPTEFLNLARQAEG